MAEVAKCPACGALRESFNAICPECGYEFTDIQTSDVLIKFTDRIDEYDRILASQAPAPKAGVGFWTILAWIFLFPVMFGIFLFKKVKAKHDSLEGNEKLKSEAILNFPIPNSRNDLLEFAFLVETKVKPLNYFNALTRSGMDIQKWNNIWKEKADHIEKKANMALREDHNSLNRIKETTGTINDRISQNDKIQWMMMGALLVAFIIFIIFLSIN